MLIARKRALTFPSNLALGKLRSHIMNIPKYWEYLNHWHGAIKHHGDITGSNKNKIHC